MNEGLKRIGQLEPKHWMLIAMFLTATSSVVGGLDHWHDLMNPKVFGGFLGQLATLITAVFVGAPSKTSDPGN